MTCGRCLSTKDLREIAICGVVDVTLCGECRSEIGSHAGIEAGNVLLRRSHRHAEIHRATLVGPAADVQACIKASDMVAHAEGSLREVIRAWIAEKPARGSN